MATPLRFSPLQVHAAIRQARTLHQRQPYPLPQIQNTPYVRPRIQGMVVGDEPIPQQRPAFGGAGGVMPTPGAPPATTPPPGPGQVPLPTCSWSPLELESPAHFPGHRPRGRRRS